MSNDLVSIYGFGGFGHIPCIKLVTHDTPMNWNCGSIATATTTCGPPSETCVALHAQGVNNAFAMKGWQWPLSEQVTPLMCHVFMCQKTLKSLPHYYVIFRRWCKYVWADNSDVFVVGTHICSFVVLISFGFLKKQMNSCALPIHFYFFLSFTLQFPSNI